MVLRLLSAVKAHEGKIWSIGWNQNGDKLISCGEDKIAKVWHFQEPNDKEGIEPPFDLLPISNFGESTHQKTLRDVAWSPCGKYVVLASFDSQITLWEVKNENIMEMISVVEGHENEVKSVAWSPSGKYFASCGRDKNVMIWTLITDKDEVDVECESVLTSHTQDVKRVVWHPMEDILASSSYDDTIKLYENDTDNGDWSTTATLTGHSSTVWGIDFHSSGTRLVSCSDDKTVKVWNKEGEKWTCGSTIAGEHKRTIYDISWSSWSDLIATASGDNHIRIFRERKVPDVHESNLFDQIFSVKVSDQDVNCVAWCPALGHVMASASDDGYLRLWQWENEM